MATLKLKSITCLDTAETGADELYVTFNGTKRSLPNMTPGQTKAINDEFTFEGSETLSLYENDGDHWYDRDDFIAKHTITESSGDITLDFKATSGHGVPAHYTISASVNASQTPTTALLRLKSINCIKTAESFTDELYITFNGTKTYLPDMTPGQTKMLNNEYLFEVTSDLSLFENDGDHWYDRDDFIGKQTITKTPAERTLEYKATSGNGMPAHYVLSVSITPVS
ncbi:hypothetical protein Q0590_00080 [Rhodocytophaga aerolata]|uniref:Uncharacterized protein n=1 Tax=Rhodocytophaga aerolata TaxID=455078 RepID=A0ABT8QXR2_9BACT|nr:hypothetical protein [Rhodocytophaga aerolata]MDO1444621.1 hypothetical protein [Rhodocytophaga aerolata]